MGTASMRSPKILKSLGTRTIFAPTIPCVFSMEVLVRSARQCACPFRIGHFGTKAARLPTDDCNLFLHYLHRTLACDKSNSVRCDTRNRFLSVYTSFVKYFRTFAKGLELRKGSRSHNLPFFYL